MFVCTAGSVGGVGLTIKSDNDAMQERRLAVRRLPFLVSYMNPTHHVSLLFCR